MPASLVSLQQGLGAAAVAENAPALTITGASLRLVFDYNWAFTVRQTFMPGFNALLLDSPSYCTDRASCILRHWGSWDAGFVITATVLTIFGVESSGTHRSGRLATSLPRSPCEVSLGLYLAFKGFKATAPSSSMTTAGSTTSAPSQPPHHRCPSPSRRQVPHDRCP